MCEKKFDEELLRVLKEREEQNSTELISVMIHFEPNIEISELERLGFKLDFQPKELNFVLGHIAPVNAYKIARLPKVTKLEFDSETHLIN
jgi:hypothetical protein